jgi:hypothetical protein
VSYDDGGVKNREGSLHPWFGSGFSDAEGSFIIRIGPNNKLKTGWRVQPVFSICLHEKDKIILERIKKYFKVGNIHKHSGTMQYIVSSPEDLAVIIAHFEKYKLLTQKRSDYELWKQVVELMNSKEHLTPVGLQKIVNLRASINNGLSPELKEAFPKTQPVTRPAVEYKGIPDPAWIVGFVNGDGCFLVSIYKATTKTGFAVKCVFSITQHNRETQLMKSLVDYLNCGDYRPRANQDAGDFVVTKFSDIIEKIIPLFNKYQMEGVKALDFADFCKVTQLIKNKDHLNQEGLEEIRKIKSGMNRGR